MYEQTAGFVSKEMKIRVYGAHTYFDGVISAAVLVWL